MACCITSTDQSKTELQRPDGLYSLHAYSMLSVLQSDTETLVLLRNPHGSSRTTGKHSEWTGRWSDYDDVWVTGENDPIVVRARSIVRRLGAERSDDGLFWMSFDDFTRIFDKIFVLAKIMESANDIIRHDPVKGNLEIVQTPELSLYDIPSKRNLPYTLQRSLDAERRIHERGWEVMEDLRGTEHTQLINLVCMESMSVAAYDPYLNPPPFLASNKPLLMQWIKDKGNAL